MQENSLNQNKNKEENVTEDFPNFQNVVDFFSLLLKVDMRENPQNYQVKKEDNDRYGDTIGTKVPG